jgi:hypothetical protein
MGERSRVVRRLCAGAVVVTTALFMLSGCSGDAEPGKPKPTTAASSTSQLDGVDDVHVAETTAAAQLQDPVFVTTRFIETWSRPDLPYQQWWTDLEPLFNAQGQQAYAGTDPAQVPRLRITGDLEVVSSTVPTSTTVWVPTDKGRFGVQLSRTGEHAEWLVSRVFFPGSGQDASEGEAGQGTTGSGL